MSNKETNDPKEMQVRILNFDRELQDLQKKYGLKLVAQVLFPIDPSNPVQGPKAILSVPIQVLQLQGIEALEPKKRADEPTKPE